VADTTDITITIIITITGIIIIIIITIIIQSIRMVKDGMDAMSMLRIRTPIIDILVSILFRLIAGIPPMPPRCQNNPRQYRQKDLNLERPGAKCRELRHCRPNRTLEACPRSGNFQ
jgi:hypothetical protein